MWNRLSARIRDPSVDALAQGRQRFPQGHGGHAELRGELGFRRELLPVHEETELDRLAHALHHLHRPSRRGEGRNQRYGVPSVGHAIKTIRMWF
jgi:hypothetical protein